MLLSLDATFIFVFISFIIFLFLMNIILYKPIMRVMKEREKFFEKNEKTLNETNMKKQELLNKIDAELNSAKTESSYLLLDTSQKTKQEKEELILNKKEEILMAQNEFEIKLDETSKEAKKTLKNDIHELVQSTVSHVLGINIQEIKTDTSKLEDLIK